MCVSRERAPLLALSLDVLSFPKLLQEANVTTLGSEVNGHGNTGPGKGRSKGNKGLLLGRQHIAQVFVRWNPFCTKWPRCLLKNVYSEDRVQ